MAVTTSQITITTMEGWYSGDTAPSNPLVGDLWLDTTDNKIKKWNGTQWELQADAQGPQGDKGDSITSRVAYWIKSSTKPNKPENESDISNWNEGSEPSENALNNIGKTDKFWRVYEETYSSGNTTYSEVELIGSYEVLNGLVQFRNRVTTTENVGGQDVTVIDGGTIKTGSIEADKMSVEDLAAFEATIGGFHIGDNSIYSGTKNSINNPTKGTYIDSNGYSYFGDDKNFIRFYQSAEDNKYKLQVSADSILFGSGVDIEEALEGVRDDVANLEIGGRNLLAFKTWCENIQLIDYIESTEGRFFLDSTVGSNGSLYTSPFIFGEIGQKYTFSSKPYTQETTRLRLDIGIYDGTTFTVKDSLGLGGSDNAFTKYLITRDDVNAVRVNYLTASVPIVLEQIKIEKGDKATDWTPAPEDVEGAINSVNNVVSRELVASSYAEIDETTGAISLYGKDKEGEIVSQLDLKSTGIELSDGEGAKARMYSNSEIGGVFQSDQMISETFRMGRFAWVSQTNGHLTLKDMGEEVSVIYE